MSAAVPALGLIRTFALVTVVAVLVWVLAEGESLNTELIEVPVVISSEAADGTVIEADRANGWTGRVYLEIEGSTRVISLVRDRLRGGIRLQPGDPGVPTDPGRHELDLADIVRRSDLLEGSVAVRSVEPETVGVLIEQLASVEAEVQVDLPEDASASAIVAEPRRVRLVYPTTAADTASAGVTVSASLTREQLASLEVGRRSTIRDVPLALPDSLRGVRFVRLDPPSVSVIATIESKTDTVLLDAVPVQIQRPAFQAERWIVTVNPEDHLISGVEVTGPSDLIERIRSGDLPVFAVVRLTPDDLDRRVPQKPVTFTDLPTSLVFDAGTAAVRLDIRPAPAGPEG